MPDKKKLVEVTDPELYEGVEVDDAAGVGSEISDVESGGDYKATNPNSTATGKYQILWGKKSGSGMGDDIKKVTGVQTRDEFLNNPQAQEDFYKWLVENKHKPAVENIRKYNQAGYSDDQLIKLVHFKGPEGARIWLDKGVDDTPEHNISIDRYVGKPHKVTLKEVNDEDLMEGEEVAETVQEGVTPIQQGEFPQTQEPTVTSSISPAARINTPGIGLNQTPPEAIGFRQPLNKEQPFTIQHAQRQEELAEQQRPLIEKQKTDESTQYLTNELAENIHQFPEYADNIQKTAVTDKGNVVHDVADPHGTPAFTGGFAKTRIAQLQQQWKNEKTRMQHDDIDVTYPEKISELDKQYSEKIDKIKQAAEHIISLQLTNKEYTEKTLDKAVADQEINTIQKSTDVQLSEINKEIEDIENQVNKINRQGIIKKKDDPDSIDLLTRKTELEKERDKITKDASQIIGKIKATTKWDAVRLGIEQKRLLGDKQAEEDAKRYDDGKLISPKAKVDYQIAGNEIKKTAKYNADANNQHPVGQEIGKHIQSDNQIETENQDYFNSERANRIGNEIYADENFIFRGLVPHIGSFSKEKIEEYGKRVGLTKSQIDKIDPKEVPASATYWQQALKGGINTFAPIYERVIGRPKMKLDGATDEEIDEAFKPGWENQRGMGAAMVGNIPSDQNSYHNLRGFIGQMAEGAGSIASFVGEVGVLSKVLKGSGLVSNAVKAEQLANFGTMAFSGYNSAYGESKEIIGDKPEDEWKRQLYSTTMGTIEGFIFSIHPPTKLVRSALGQEVKTGEQLLKEIKNAESIGVVKTPEFQEKVAQNIYEIAKANGTMVTLSVANQMSKDLIDGMINPEVKKNIAEDVKTNAISTSIAMMIPSIFAGIGRVRSQTPLNKAAAFEVGTNPKKYIEQTAKLLQEGKMTTEDAQKTHEAILAMSTVIKQTPIQNTEGEMLTPDQVKDYSWSLLQENILQKEADKISEDATSLGLNPDKAQLEPINKKIKEQEAQRQTILKDAGVPIKSTLKERNQAPEDERSVATDLESETKDPVTEIVTDYIGKREEEYKELSAKEGETPEEYERHIELLKTDPEAAIQEERTFYEKSLERELAKEEPNEKEVDLIHDHIDELEEVSDKIDTEKKKKEKVVKNKEEDISLSSQREQSPKTKDHGIQESNEQRTSVRQDDQGRRESETQGSREENGEGRHESRPRGELKEPTATEGEGGAAQEQQPPIPVSRKEQRRKLREEKFIVEEEETPVPSKAIKEQSKETPNPARSVATDAKKEQPSSPTKTEEIARTQSKGKQQEIRKPGGEQEHARTEQAGSEEQTIQATSSDSDIRGKAKEKPLRNQSKKGWKLSEHLNRREKVSKEPAQNIDEFILQSMIGMSDKRPDGKWNISSLAGKTSSKKTERDSQRNYFSDHKDAQPIDQWAEDIVRSAGTEYGLEFNVGEDSAEIAAKADQYAREFPSKQALVEHLEKIQEDRKEAQAQAMQGREGEPTEHELAQMYLGEKSDHFEGYDDEGHPIYKEIESDYDAIDRAKLTETDGQKIKDYYSQFYDEKTGKIDHDKAHTDYDGLDALKAELSEAGKKLIEDILPFNNFEEHDQSVQKLIQDAEQYTKQQRETTDEGSTERGIERPGDIEERGAASEIESASPAEKSSQDRLKEIDEELVKHRAAQKISAHKRDVAEKAKDIPESNRHNANFYKKQEKIERLEEERSDVINKLKREERHTEIRQSYKKAADSIRSLGDSLIPDENIVGSFPGISPKAIKRFIEHVAEIVEQVGNLHVAIDAALRRYYAENPEEKHISAEDIKQIKEEFEYLRPEVHREPTLPATHKKFAELLAEDMTEGEMSYDEAVAEVMESEFKNKEGNPVSEKVADNAKAKIINYLDWVNKDRGIHNASLSEPSNKNNVISSYELTESDRMTRMLSGDTIEIWTGDKPMGDQEAVAYDLGLAAADSQSMVSKMKYHFGTDVMQWGKEMIKQINQLPGNETVKRVSALIGLMDELRKDRGIYEYELSTLGNSEKDNLRRAEVNRYLAEIPLMIRHAEKAYQKTQREASKTLNTGRIMAKLFTGRFAHDLHADRALLQPEQQKEKQKIEEAEGKTTIPEKIVKEGAIRDEKTADKEIEDIQKELVTTEKGKEKSKSAVSKMKETGAKAKAKDKTRADQLQRDAADKLARKGMTPDNMFDKIKDLLKKIKC